MDIHYHFPPGQAVTMTVSRGGEQKIVVGELVGGVDSISLEDLRRELNQVQKALENIMTVNTSSLATAIATLKAKDQVLVDAFIVMRDHLAEVAAANATLTTQVADLTTQLGTVDAATQTILDDMKTTVDGISASVDTTQTVIQGALVANPAIPDPPPVAVADPDAPPVAVDPDAPPVTGGNDGNPVTGGTIGQ
jgi:hypothetical protein